MSDWLDRLREVGEAATPGPWSHLHSESDGLLDAYDSVRAGEGIEICYDERCVSPEEGQANIAFIVRARNTWPLLVAVVEAAERAEVAHNHGGVGPKVGCAGCELTDVLASLREATK